MNIAFNMRLYIRKEVFKQYHFVVWYAPLIWQVLILGVYNTAEKSSATNSFMPKKEEEKKKDSLSKDVLWHSWKNL